MDQNEEIFKHTPLTHESHIRILCLEPSLNFESDIRCRLIEPSLDLARGRYEALSYVWGSQICDAKVTCDGRSLPVTTNCFLALRYLRKKTKLRFLWIDAICINQSSNDERGHQVGLMGEIYKFAYQVIIWLGEQQPETKRTFRRAYNCYRITRRFEKVEKIIEGRALPAAFLPLLKHPWFQRVWTFQELLMAKRATIQCGNCSIPWRAFVARIKHFANSDVAEKRQCQIVQQIDRARTLWQCQVSLADRHENVVPVGGRKRPTYFASPPTLTTLESLFVIASLWEGTQPRSSSVELDRYFGLYGLLREIGFDLPKPDYFKTSLEIAQEVTLSQFIMSCSLMPLYCFVERRFNSGSPSWALDWEHFEANSKYIRPWGIEEGDHRHFRPDFRPSFGERRLNLEGILYGTLRPFGSLVPNVVGCDALHGRIPFNLLCLRWLNETLNMIKPFQNCPNGQSAREAFLTALVLGYQKRRDPRTTLMEITRVLSQCGTVVSQSQHHVNLSKLIPVLTQLDMSFDDEPSAYNEDVMIRLASCVTEAASQCSGGTLFRTSDNWIGITMSAVLLTDIVALLHGSSVPAILRPVGEYYQLVCFASIQGIPDCAWPERGDEPGTQSIVLI